jgi:hypothetical protein
MVSEAFNTGYWTANPGDRISRKPQTIEEKAKQIAVDAPDITGDRIKVPTYFIVEYPDGEKKALHHVRDAQQISDVIRQMQLNDKNWGQASPAVHHSQNFNFVLVLFVLGLMMSCLFLIGIF